MEKNNTLLNEEISQLPGVVDVAKKIVTTCLGAAFMTEEGVRAYVSNMKLPKEMLSVILQGASKSKDEMITRVSDEVIKIIRKIDFVQEASRFVEDHKFKISAEIEVIKKTPQP